MNEWIYDYVLPQSCGNNICFDTGFQRIKGDTTQHLQRRKRMRTNGNLPSYLMHLFISNIMFIVFTFLLISYFIIAKLKHPVVNVFH